MLKLGHRLSTRVLTVSAQSYPYRPAEALAVGHGIDCSLFTPDGSAPVEPPELLGVGRLSPIKDAATLLRAVHQLRTDGVAVQARWIGGSPERDLAYAGTVAGLSRELGLDAAFRFAGAVSNRDLPAWYRRSAAHVNLSPAGLFDKSARRQSMACGVPTLVANEAFAPAGRWADFLLFRHGDAAHLARQASRVLALEADARRQMGRDRAPPSWRSTASSGSGTVSFLCFRRKSTEADVVSSPARYACLTTGAAAGARNLEQGVFNDDSMPSLCSPAGPDARPDRLGHLPSRHRRACDLSECPGPDADRARTPGRRARLRRARSGRRVSLRGAARPRSGHALVRLLGFSRTLARVSSGYPLWYVNDYGVPALLGVAPSPARHRHEDRRRFPAREYSRRHGWTADGIDEFQTRTYGWRIAVLKRLQCAYVRSARRVIVPSRYLAGLVEGWGVPGDPDQGHPQRRVARRARTRDDCAAGRRAPDPRGGSSRVVEGHGPPARDWCACAPRPAVTQAGRCRRRSDGWRPAASRGPARPRPGHRLARRHLARTSRRLDGSREPVRAPLGVPKASHTWRWKR